MPRNGSGTYTAPANSFNPAVANTVIDPDDWDAILADLSTALTDSLDRTGDGAMEANLDMGTFSITNASAISATSLVVSTINKVTITTPATAATLTLANNGSLITSGAFPLTLTVAATANATIPSGTHTLVATDVTAALTNKTYNNVTITTPATAATLTIANNGSLVTSGAVPITISATTTATLAVGVGGTLTGSSSSAIFYDNIPQNSQSAAYTAVAGDAMKHILHPTSDNNARTFTIPSNAAVPFPTGTAITFVNQINTVTIAIASDTLTLAGSGSTGSRTLAANGIATAIKVASTSWVINGTGIT